MRTSPLVLLVLAGCSEQTVGKHNVAPEATILSPANGDTVEADAVVSFRGTAGDTNDAASSLLATWFAGSRELCAPTAPADDNTTSCDAALAEGESTVTLEVVDPAGSTATASVSLTVTADAAPTASITAPTGTDTVYAGQLVTFAGSVADTDDAATDLTVAWASSLDGALPVDDTPDASGALAGATTLTEGEHYLTLTATDPSGKTGEDSLVLTVRPPNAPPSCEITAPEDGSVGEEGDALTLRAVVSDPDIASDRLLASWSSDYDGPLGDSTPTSGGDVVFTTSSLSAHTHTLTLTVTDEVGATCSDLIVYTVGSPPEATIEAPLDGEVVVEGTTVEFTALVGDGEDRPEELDVQWASDLDGTLDTTPPDSSGVAAFATAGLSRGDHLITLTVSDTAGLYVVERVHLVVDGAPTAPRVSITPASPSGDDTLTATLDAASTDPDGDPVSYRYDWYQDGVLSGASSTSTLPATATSRGETWSVVVTPSDGYTDGPSGTASATIGNTAPTLTSVTLSPDPVASTGTLTCSPSGASDADGDAVTTRYAWLVDGASVAGTSATLGSSSFSPGASVVCVVTPNDGATDGAAVTSSPARVNHPPTVASATLSPPAPTGTEDLTCTAGATADADGDTVSLAYAWTVDGAPAGTGATLAASAYGRGDTVVCTITPSDSLESGPVASASVTIANLAPSVSSATLTPDPVASTGTLTCTPGTLSDPDGDAVTATFGWTVAGAPVAATTATLSSASFDAGDDVSCTVTPTDGAANGTPVESNVVRVNSPPQLATVSLSPGSPTGSDTLTCTAGGATDADGDAVSITYRWTIDGTEVATGPTLAASFTTRGDVVGCTATPADALEPGAAISTTVTIADSAPTLASVTLSPNPVASTGTLTCVPGAASDPDGDAVSYRYAWTVGGSAAAATSATLAPPSFGAGDDVACTVTPTDGTLDGAAVASAPLIVHSPPTLTSATVTPDPASPVSTLTCAATGVADVDGDTTSVTYAWTVNGVDVGSGPTLSPGSFTTDDLVMCTATVSDALEEGGSASDYVIITGSAPVVDSVTLSPSAPGTNDVLTATATTHDGEGDPVTLSWAWYVNGALATSTTDTLDGATAFSRGNVVYAVATPYDGVMYGTPVASASLTIQNTAPTTPGITVSPSRPRSATDALVCSITTAATDADADSVSYTISWTRNGSSWTGATSTTTRTGDTIAASSIASTDVWVCSVRASDGTANSDTATATANARAPLTGTALTSTAYGLTGAAQYDYAGDTVAIIPDIDGDGKSELLVAAKLRDRNDGDPYYEGIVYMVLGKNLRSTGSASLSSASYVWTADESDDHLGTGLTGLGDIDGDGVGDFAIGAYQGYSGARGRAYVFSGAHLGAPGTYSPNSSARWVITGANSQDYVGTFVADAGDVDGDGRTELAVGAWGYDTSSYTGAGAVFVFRGSDFASGGGAMTPSNARWTIEGVRQNNYIGRIFSAGDVDGDGLSDLFIGDDRSSSSGCVHIFTADTLGSSGTFAVTSATFEVEPATGGSSCGTTVAVGDYDGDGLADFATGDYSYSADGAFFVVTATDLVNGMSLDDATWRLDGVTNTWPRYVVNAGDNDGDGRDDLMVYDQLFSGNGTGVGALLLFYADTLDTVGLDYYDADWMTYATSATEGFYGQTFGAGPHFVSGDLNDDGTLDFAAAAQQNDSAATDAGKVYVVWGP